MSRIDVTGFKLAIKGLVLSGRSPGSSERRTAFASGGFAFWFILVGWGANARQLLATGIVLAGLAAASLLLATLSSGLSGFFIVISTSVAWLVSFLSSDQVLQAMYSAPDEGNPGRPFLFLFLVSTVGGAEILRQQHDARLRRSDQARLLALADQVALLSSRVVGEIPASRIAAALRSKRDRALADRAEFLSPQGCREIRAEAVRAGGWLAPSIDRHLVDAARRQLQGEELSTRHSGDA